MLLSLLLVGNASAHGASFRVTAVSIAPDDPDAAWAVTTGWGVVRTQDGGATWTWLCEEATGGGEVYAVLARPDGRAWIGTRDGIVSVGADCTATAVAGVPEGAYVGALVAYEDGVLALVTGGDAGGVYRCDDAGCAPSELVSGELYPKAIVVDADARVYVTTVAATSLAGALWASDDGEAWRALHAWPDGTVDPRVLRAEGGTVLVWERTRDAGDAPGLVRSTDGGVTFARVLEAGGAGEDPAGLVAHDGTLLVGTIAARTWRSTDGGAAWEEVTREAPVARCGAVGPDGTALVCGDHLAEGVDLYRSNDLRSFAPVACLEDATVDACGADACAPYAEAYATATAYGGGACDAVDTGVVAPPDGCGCGGGRVAGGLWLLLVAAAGVGRRFR